jgi:CO/xanthine dehydrogenase Mo-binding subunit
VIASTEHEAQRALDRLRAGAVWSEEETLPEAQDLGRFLAEAPATTTVVHAAGTLGTLPPDATLHEADYLKPYIAHASIGPSCAVARWHDGKLEVWTHSQGIRNLRKDLVLALRGEPQPVASDAITVHHVEGAGCYGHNGADDAAFDAVLLALRMPGRPVRVLWSRADELAWSPFGPAQRVRLQAVIGQDKRLQQWRHELWANGATARPGRANTPALVAATHRATASPPLLSTNPALRGGGGSDRNSIPPYDIPNQEVVNHRLDFMPIRASSLRSLGAYANVFAAESFMDEIAHALGEDPVAFRRRHLSDARGLAVLDRLVTASRWWSTPREARAPHVGHGLAIARYKSFAGWCAVAARVEAGEVLRVQELDIAVDVGRVIHPDGVANQVEGGALQAVSWTLKEQVAFDRTRITSDSWPAYPILRFSEVPAVNVFIVDRPDCDSEGAGELAQGPVAAAIANALYDALGVRVRRLPLTPETITQSMT